LHLSSFYSFLFPCLLVLLSLLIFNSISNMLLFSFSMFCTQLPAICEILLINQSIFNDFPIFIVEVFAIILLDAFDSKSFYQSYYHSNLFFLQFTYLFCQNAINFSMQPFSFCLWSPIVFHFKVLRHLIGALDNHCLIECGCFKNVWGACRFLSSCL
jgi:hypothetical protein